MRKSIFVILLFLSSLVMAQDNELLNPTFLKALYKDSTYEDLKSMVIRRYAYTDPLTWNAYMSDVDSGFVNQKKILALTFDACGGPNGSKYDSSLIGFLRKERVPATLFITGRWIDANYKTFLKLAEDTLFEIENHGLDHKPCSIDGDVVYGIKGTQSLSEAFDEIEANARKIEKVTGRRPMFYRSATTFADEPCSRMAACLNMFLVSYDVLSCDAIPDETTEIIKREVLKHVKPGAVVIMHFNHPVWNTYESLKVLLPELRKRGYTFVKLQDYPMKYNKKALHVKIKIPVPALISLSPADTGKK